MTQSEETDGPRPETPCPFCGADLTPIVYGLPGPELQERAQRGELVLGGCLVHSANPDWACEDCGKRWEDEDLAGER